MIVSSVIPELHPSHGKTPATDALSALHIMYKPLPPSFFIAFLMRNGSFVRNKKRNSKGVMRERTNIMLDIGLKQSLQRLSNKTKMSL
ncbi:hypothetical protein [Klebsiella pneumoniae]|uniref:hypothetical protein n=1 Tax=Klebsiella pneumoniae TaxID=573 RepID=UPI0022B5FF76|nr:hypothetical protein [Klebsiella pneumoniae]